MEERGKVLSSLQGGRRIRYYILTLSDAFRLMHFHGQRTRLSASDTDIRVFCFVVAS